MTSYISGLTLPNVVFQQPAISILLPIALGTAVGYANSPKATQEKYMALKQPPFRPPPQAFGPLWTAMYGLMGFAAYRAWNTGNGSFNPEVVALTQQGATLYTIQLGLNLIWMPTFFRFKMPIAAAVDAAAMTLVTGYLTYVWSQVDEVAAACLVPYVAWGAFATYLTIGVGYMNDWDLADKMVDSSPADKLADTDYINQKAE